MVKQHITSLNTEDLDPIIHGEIRIIKAELSRQEKIKHILTSMETASKLGNISQLESAINSAVTLKLAHCGDMFVIQKVLSLLLCIEEFVLVDTLFLKSVELNWGRTVSLTRQILDETVEPDNLTILVFRL